ncbi:protein of unknown function [Candidatus Nitrotoga arctica]|uniref:Uncharacterized protein n=1 Tax=Candidatus Nitrotoga arctica TaxID=453162 RepID=A0ABN8APA8_9PROT|nr:protein of unknown function [Candidatus Nitrotoga arctica]
MHLHNGLRGQDLNLRPSGYEPDELPDCSTPRQLRNRTIAKQTGFVKHYSKLLTLTYHYYLVESVIFLTNCDANNDPSHLRRHQESISCDAQRNVA